MTSYGVLLDRSDKCLAFLEKLGEKRVALNGRFGEYKSLVQRIWNDIQSGNRDNVLDFVNKNGVRNGDVAFFALKEFMEMIVIFEQIELLYSTTSERQKQIIIEKVNITLGGPAYTKDESDKNNTARNFQFELLVASKLYSVGITDISFEVHPDIMVKVGDLRYAIECKRIFSKLDQKTLKRAEEGLVQLVSIKKEIFCGLVALDFSTKYEQGKNLLNGSTKESIADFAQSCLLRDFIYIYKNSYRLVKANKDKYFVGIIGNISSIYALKDKSEFGHLSQMAIFAFSKENPIKSRTFLGDFGKLDKINIIQ